MREYWLDPPEYDEPKELDPFDEYIYLYYKGEIIVHAGDDEFEYPIEYVGDPESKWLEEDVDKYDEFRCHSDGVFSDITVDDVSGVEEKLWDILLANIPEPGRYNVEFEIGLHYLISGVGYLEPYEDEFEYFIDDAESSYEPDDNDVTTFQYTSIE